MLNLLKILVRPIHPLDETVIDAGMPSIRIDPLLIEVDQQINFSRTSSQFSNTIPALKIPCLKQMIAENKKEVTAKTITS